MGVSQGEDMYSTACSHATPWEAEHVIVPIKQTGILRFHKVNMPCIIQRVSRWWILDGNPDWIGGKVWISPLQRKAFGAEGYPQPHSFIPLGCSDQGHVESNLPQPRRTCLKASAEPLCLKHNDALGSGLRYSF